MSENELMVPTVPEITEPTNPYMADYQQSLIMQYIEDFQNTLDENHEIGVYLANFGAENWVYGLWK